MSAESFLELGSGGWDEFDGDGHIWPTETCAVEDAAHGGSCDKTQDDLDQVSADPSCDDQDWDNEITPGFQDPSQVWKDTAMDQSSWWEGAHAQDPDQVWDGETADQGWEDHTTDAEMYPHNPDQVWVGWEDHTTEAEMYPHDPDQVWVSDTADQGWKDDVTSQAETYNLVWDGATLDQGWEDQAEPFLDREWTQGEWGEYMAMAESDDKLDLDRHDQDTPKNGHSVDQWWPDAAVNQDLQWGLVEQPDVNMSDVSQVAAAWWSDPSSAQGAEKHALGWGSGDEDKAYLATKVSEKRKGNQEFLRELDVQKKNAPEDPDR